MFSPCFILLLGVSFKFIRINANPQKLWVFNFVWKYKKKGENIRGLEELGTKKRKRKKNKEMKFAD